MLVPYIGITDFTRISQAREMLAVLGKHPLGQSKKRHLMIGVMMSNSTLRGLISKWTDIWPRKEVIGQIFPDDPLALGCIHYADYDSDTDLSHLQDVVYWGGSNLRALQLDMIWPRPRMLQQLRETFSGKIVLQVSQKAFAFGESSPDRLPQKLDEYGVDLIDCVLLDCSLGHGRPLNAEMFRPYLQAIRSRLPKLSLAVAGGLGPETMHLLQPLVGEFPDISIDAQGQLRPSGSSTKPADWGMAKSYLYQALDLFGQQP